MADDTNDNEEEADVYKDATGFPLHLGDLIVIVAFKNGRSTLQQAILTAFNEKGNDTVTALLDDGTFCYRHLDQVVYLDDGPLEPNETIGIPENVED